MAFIKRERQITSVPLSDAVPAEVVVRKTTLTKTITIEEVVDDTTANDATGGAFHTELRQLPNPLFKNEPKVETKKPEVMREKGNLMESRKLPDPMLLMGSRKEQKIEAKNPEKEVNILGITRQLPDQMFIRYNRTEQKLEPKIPDTQMVIRPSLIETRQIRDQVSIEETRKRETLQEKANSILSREFSSNDHRPFRKLSPIIVKSDQVDGADDIKTSSQQPVSSKRVSFQDLKMDTIDKPAETTPELINNTKRTTFLDIKSHNDSLLKEKRPTHTSIAVKELDEKPNIALNKVKTQIIQPCKPIVQPYQKIEPQSINTNKNDVIDSDNVILVNSKYTETDFDSVDSDDGQMVFEPDPMKIECEKCKKRVKTFIYHKTGKCTWTLCCLLFFFGLWPFAIISLIGNCSKDVIHNCPSCQSYMGIYRRPDDLERLKNKRLKEKASLKAGKKKNQNNIAKNKVNAEAKV